MELMNGFTGLFTSISIVDSGRLLSPHKIRTITTANDFASGFSGKIETVTMFDVPADDIVLTDTSYRISVGNYFQENNVRHNF